MALEQQPREALLVVGFGKMGRLYHSLLGANYLVDPKLSDGAGAQAEEFSSLERFLERDRPVTLAIVATPIDTHFELACQLLERGVHVLLEKPLCGSAALATRLEELALNRGRLLLQSCPERYNPALRFVLRHISLDRIVSVRSFRFGACPPYGSSDTVHLDLAIHDVDLWAGPFGTQVPWEVNVGYGAAERRLEILLYDGRTVTIDMAQKQVTLGSKRWDLSRAVQNHPLVEMVFDAQYAAHSDAVSSSAYPFIPALGWSGELRCIEERHRYLPNGNCRIELSASVARVGDVRNQASDPGSGTLTPFEESSSVVAA